MKKIGVLGISTIILGCTATQDTVNIDTKPQTKNQLATNQIAKLKLANPSNFARKDETTFFTFDSLGLNANDPRVANIVVKNGTQVIPSQNIDTDNDGFVDQLAILNQFDSGQSIELMIEADRNFKPNFEKRTQAEVSHKVGGHWDGKKYIGGTFKNVDELTAPEQYTDHSEYIRYEGPGLESDKVGYRFYLDWRNGFDIFGKVKNEIALHKVGQDGYASYHEMQDWGMDVLKVGKAVGVGGYGHWNGQAIERVSKVDGWHTEIVENGPVYSSLEIDYKGWHVNNQHLDLTSHMSMTAGSRLVHVELETSEKLDDIALGIVKWPNTTWLQGEMDIQGTGWVYFASYGKQSLNDDNLGMAIFVRKTNIKEVTQDEHNYVVVTQSNHNELEYYFTAAWEKEENGITNQADFVQYLEQTAERLTRTVRVNKTTKLGQAEKQKPLTADYALDWAKRLADSELRRKAYDYVYGGFDKMRFRESKYTYTTGLLAQSFDDLNQATDVPRYRQAAEAIIGSFITPEGQIITYKESDYNIDKINSGKMLLRLYNQTGDDKYRVAAAQLRTQLKNHPKTSQGAFWHKKIYPHQLWLDGVYMGMPFLAQYSSMFEDGASLEEAVHEFEVTRDYLRDPQTGLYFHGWDESKSIFWANPQTGLSQEFWARGMGWLAMAAVDILDYIPESRSDLRKKVQTVIDELAVTLKNYQDETGTWYQIPNKPDAVGNYLESSASSMFTYFYAKGINKGYISKDYTPVALKAYQGLVNEFIETHPDGSVSLTNLCFVAGLGFGRDGSYAYYMNEPVLNDDPKGTGPFIMASTQIAKLIK
ncbi:glycoside hydrolase family 88 protein [Catenovulum sp. 2E275]|uniref:glycoside hydrolase family 88 protein n=1 Tax=Catenovulum sp. 2E275 TaxID=2980497 RepID=UPI0021CEDF28|nr:glycoside hydrolase family 88 protein [Catenovulum sp. 2E275]MCU4677092.1 glycoside hydrolase family 88 protein [Catenovulum sp. 2E275]